MQPKPTCSVPNCAKTSRRAGMCAMHYERKRKHGDPGESGLARISGTVEEQFWPRVNKNGPIPLLRPDLGNCWLWTGGCNPAGYGRLKSFGLVHHFLVGKPPKGLEYDHLCRTHNCVRPEHLEAVSHAENVRRGSAGKPNATKTHCPKGHPYAGDNLYVSPNRVGRGCRMCSRESSLRWVRKKALQKAAS